MNMPEQTNPDMRRVASWNISNGLTDPARLTAIAEAIREINPDIMVLPEAFDTHKDDNVEPASKVFQKMGYEARFIGYKDARPELYRVGGVPHQALCVLGRFATGAAVERIRFGERNAAMIFLHEFGGHVLSIAGVHYDDRREELRLPAVRATIDAEPDLIIGDFNMHPTSGWVQYVAGSYAYDATLPFVPLPPRWRSLAKRFGYMADGRGMELLADAKYHDLDPSKQPTMKLGGRAIAQLDRAMLREGAPATASATQVYDFAPSDHRAISVDLTPAA